MHFIQPHIQTPPHNTQAVAVHDALQAHPHTLHVPLLRGVQRVHCLYGTNQETVLGARFARSTFDDPAPEHIVSNGDGVVPHESLALCREWIGARNDTKVSVPQCAVVVVVHGVHAPPPPPQVSVLEFPNQAHGALLAGAAVKPIVDVVLQAGSMLEVS